MGTESTGTSDDEGTSSNDGTSNEDAVASDTHASDIAVQAPPPPVMVPDSAEDAGQLPSTSHTTQFQGGVS